MLNIAHRGASGTAPENTLPAIEKAIEAGVDVLYLEVQGTKDRVPVIFADTRLERTTSGTGRIAQMDSKDFLALDAGSWFNEEFKGAKPLTLEQAIKAAGAKTRLMLLMPELPAGDKLTEAVIKALGARKKPEQDILLFSSSDALKAMSEKLPNFSYCLALGEKTEGWLHVEKAVRLGLKVIRPHRHAINPAAARLAREKGVLVLAYFADEAEDMRKLLDMRVDGIITGRPERLRVVLEEAGLAKK